MTPAQFRSTIHRLGFPSPYAAAGVLGITRQQAYKLAGGPPKGSKVTKTMQRLLAMYERYGVPKEWLPREDLNL